MKMINRKVGREIKGNLSFYISVTLLTAITVFLVAVAFSDAAMIQEDIGKLMADCHVEDAQFQTILTLEDEDIESLEAQYDVEIEQTAYMDAALGDKTLRIFKPMESVNVYTLLEGEDVTEQDEILFDRDFANANHIEIGDIYAIDGKSFTVTGLAVRPDYLYSKKSLQDMWIDKENFGMIQVSAADYESLLAETDWNESTYYSVIFHDESMIEAFRQAIYGEYSAYSYLSAEANSRIESPRGAGDEILMQSWSLAPILFIVIMLLISIVIGRILEREKKYVGTLLALGYQDREISLHYCMYAILPGFMGSVLGLLLAIFAGKGVAMYFVIDYQSINYSFYIRPHVLAICLLLPTILYGCVSYFKSIRMVRRNIVSMLREQDEHNGRKRRRRMLERSQISFQKKFKIRSLFAHMGRTLMVLFCLFLSSFLCAFGFSLNDSCRNLVEEGTNNACVYEYSYYLNGMHSGEDFGGLVGLVVTYETASHGTITLSGVPAGSRFQDMEILGGDYREDGFYLTNAAAVEYGLKAGDEMTIVNPVTLEETTVQLDGIAQDNSQQILYTSYTNVKEIIEVEEDYFNVVYSDTELFIESDALSYVGDNDGILDTLMNAMTALNTMVYGIMAIGCLLSIISVYLIVNLLIGENKSNISMFKVLGYQNREINKMILNINHILVVIGFLLAIPASVAAVKILCINMVSLLHIVIEPSLRAGSVALCAVIILCSYCLSLLLLRKKVDRIDMVTCLKGNRE